MALAKGMEKAVRSADHRQRRAPRRNLKIPVVVRQETGERIVTTHTLDFSTGGAKIKLDLSVDLPERFLIVLSEGGEVQRLCNLIWRTADEVGVRFVQPTSPRGAAPAARGGS
jgi:hypothetical protein